MHNDDIDRLLEQGLSGDPPGEVFRARVLLESTTALARAGGSRNRWRLAALSAAAVFIATASFALGRYSVSVSEPKPTPESGRAEVSATVAVPNELLEWLDAAQLFRQLGMTDRMARAVERASRLLPRDAVIVGQESDRVFGDSESVKAPQELVESGDTSHPSMGMMNRILARSLGD